MLILNRRVEQAPRIYSQVVLPFDQREKCRLKVQLLNGQDAAIFTQRGTILRDGNLLRAQTGEVVQVRAAKEQTYRVECSSMYELLRCAFHLGNRHTQVQFISKDSEYSFLRIRSDGVLKEMLEGLGALVVAEEAEFEPEGGAYYVGHSHASETPVTEIDPTSISNYSVLAPIPVRQKIHRATDDPTAA